MLWLENASTLHAVISANLILYMHGVLQLKIPKHKSKIIS